MVFEVAASETIFYFFCIITSKNMNRKHLKLVVDSMFAVQGLQNYESTAEFCTAVDKDI